MAPTPEHQAEVLALHADPRWGSPFWHERLGQCGMTAADLCREPESLPPLSAADLRGRPLTAFLPRSLLAQHPYLITGETSGFSGKPVLTAFLESEFRAGFVTPFLMQAARVGFPVRSAWLWAGPSGPHIIGKAVRAILREVDGLDPFAVDFDPRWFRRLPADSLPARRYLEHLYDQILDLLATQSIDVIFTTPPVLRLLAERLPAAERSRFRGVHYGGMAMGVSEYLALRAAFPAAVHMSGYGNSLFGMFPETGFGSDGIRYTTDDSPRLQLDVVRESAPGRWTSVAEGETGSVRLSRYDRSVLLLNLVLEDQATRIAGGILHPHRDPREFKGKLLY